VKLTRALVHDIDKAVKEVKLLGEHEEESSQKITELEALCTKLREDAQKLEEEKATLEEMVVSHDELITEITKEIGLEYKGEDDEAKDEDDDDGGDVATPRAPMTPVATAPEEIIEEEDPVEMVLEQEAPVAHEVILANAEPELSQPRLYRMLMRDYTDSSSRMMDDLDDPTKANSNMDEWFPEDGSNDRD
jgi:hypothetical protein